MTAPQKFPIARQSAGHAPPRRPNSIRRTTSIDSQWPEGRDGPRKMTGLARDILTSASGETIELATGSFTVVSSPLREIVSIELTPDHPRAQALIGLKAGGGSRKVLRETVSDLVGTPIYQLLDDFPGASLVGGWVWLLHAAVHGEENTGASHPRRRMLDVCIGFAEGASSLLDDGSANHSRYSHTAVTTQENPEDPEGWHGMPAQEGSEARRTRRIDLWREGCLIKIDAGFQDSGCNPAGGRSAVHEYRIHAEVDAESGTLVAMQALPLVLPHPECPGASVKASRMIGKNVADFRHTVQATLPSTAGCTHLNDMLRALADVPALARSLPPG